MQFLKLKKYIRSIDLELRIVSISICEWKFTWEKFTYQIVSGDDKPYK